MHFEERYISLIDDVLAQYEGFDLSVSQGTTEDAKSGPPSRYLASHRHEYLRTVQDIHRHFARDLESGKDVRILEIGTFFGAASIALSRLGFSVTASDVPEYIEMPEQHRRFSHEGISTHAMRLEDYIIDFPDETFDAVVMCEVLEHLNFNPLPLIKEINRVLRTGGLFCLALPNMASIYNRRKLIFGKSIGVSVQGFFNQLDPGKLEIANGHWREYTAQDIRDMLLPLGFRINSHYFFSLGECLPATSLRKRLARAFYATFPQLKENQTVLATKNSRTGITFSIPKTVHPTLETL